MCKIILLCFVFIVNVISCKCVGIFHENTRITFRADEDAQYFGYSVVLNNTGLFVGAPKARSRIETSIFTGLVFSCPTDNLSGNVTCTPLHFNGAWTTFKSKKWPKDRLNTLRDDMWFGAVLALIPTGKLLICAPRWSFFMFNFKDNVPNGACFVHGGITGEWLFPLQEIGRGYYIMNGRPQDINGVGAYEYAQAGMSAKVTEGSTLIIGVPGLILWTGAICEYHVLYPESKNKSVELYKPSCSVEYTSKHVDALFDYIGYSVESGIFDSSGKILYVAGAPRSKAGYGQVLIFEKSIRNVKANITGPHLGSYFGASVLCVDVNSDGVVDLLVGATNYATDGRLIYNQGAVFVYLTKRLKNNEFVLEEAGFVMGSGKSGARFGTAIAELGDVDGDGFTDVAIGAPWDDDGKGSVYIYRGGPDGLVSSYVQKVAAADGKAFGISISKGLDVDGNNCNDLAVGAYDTETAYLFRCIPTMQVFAQKILVPDAMDLPQNVTNFTALFCVTSSAKPLWPLIKIDLTAKVIVDVRWNRAEVLNNSEFKISLKPGSKDCMEKTIKVKPNADLSKPIPIKLSLTPIELMKDDSNVFLKTATRLSEDSVLERNIDVQVTRGCGKDLICTPSLTMKSVPLANPYIPGSDQKLGITITISNSEEPAFGAKLYLTLPSEPKRLPSNCILEERNVTCQLPSPLYKGELALCDIELEPILKYTIDKEAKILIKLEDSVHKNNELVEELKIAVTPIVNITLDGKVLPNKTITVTRNMLNNGESVNFSHYFEVTNYGPSDMYRLSAALHIADQVNLTSEVKRCVRGLNRTECVWSLPANVSMPVILPFRFDLRLHKDYLEENTPLDITSKIELFLDEKSQSFSTTTTLVLESGPPVWPWIVGLIVGILLLAASVFGLYKYGFFSRTKRDELKKLQERQDEPDVASNAESSRELLED